MTVVPNLKVQCVKLKTGTSSVDNMIRGWVQMGLSDTGFLSGIFLNASRYLSRYALQGQILQLSNMATWYKLTCVRAINGAINARQPGGMRFNDAIVAQVLILALDDVSSRGVCLTPDARCIFSANSRLSYR